jgi:hypothetical protein
VLDQWRLGALTQEAPQVNRTGLAPRPDRTSSPSDSPGDLRARWLGRGSATPKASGPASLEPLSPANTDGLAGGSGAALSTDRCTARPQRPMPSSTSGSLRLPAARSPFGNEADLRLQGPARTRELPGGLLGTAPAPGVGPKGPPPLAERPLGPGQRGSTFPPEGRRDLHAIRVLFGSRTPVTFGFCSPNRAQTLRRLLTPRPGIAGLARPLQSPAAAVQPIAGAPRPRAPRPPSRGPKSNSRAPEALRSTPGLRSLPLRPAALGWPNRRSAQSTARHPP